MALSAGTRIGNYEILGPAGVGGMGEVYRARDIRLDRLVAVKALPAELAEHPERLARFEQEARLLAALNHPNIAGIHGIEDGAEGGPYLVLEFVDGPTLSQKLANGPLGVADTLRYGAQIAAAVEAAHDKGIVHRDLKPGNIMISATNAVKVLDFGLAKGDQAGEESSPDLTASPTVAGPVTGDGIVLGTAPYMSPEQARGKPVDRRVDVWAFGCILMECLTGKQVFPGETPSDVIAKILEREPDYDALPPGTPPRLLDLIRRCLTKDADRRPRYIGDLGRELQGLRSDRSGSGSGAAAKAEDDVPSVAVLYFKNLANDPDSEYFCSGITEDILTDLSKIGGLKVASRNAVARYQGKDVDLHRIAVDLGVGTVLEGSVRRAGDRIRITVQLINASDGFQLWGERFDRTLDDVFAVQDEIAGAVVQALRVAMSPSDVAEIQRERPDDARAYDLYLRGREKYGRYTEEDMSEALELFGQAIEIDPGYALAWAGRADAFAQRAIRRWGNKDESLRLGFEAAHKAIELDPRLPDPHKAMGNLYIARGEFEETVRCLEKAEAIDPEYVPALTNLGVTSVQKGDLAGAERRFRRVRAIDPAEFFCATWLADILVWTGRTEEAVSLTRSLREDSDVPLYVTASYETEIMLLRIQGDREGEEALLDVFEADTRVPGQARAVRAHFLARIGRADEARRLIRESLEALSDWMHKAVSTDLIGAAYRIGDEALALHIARAAKVQEHLLFPVSVRMAPECLRLLDVPEFGPRVLDTTLVWPLQAPMIDEARFAVFREMKVESGRP